MMARWTTVVGLLCFSVNLATAHPTHVSFSEAVWNAETNCLEITARVAGDHFQDAIQRHFDDADFRLESEDAESTIRKYVAAHFQARASRDRTIAYEMRWVGFEIKTQDAWLYFEFSLPPDWQKIRVTNSLLFEVVDKQTNLLSLAIDHHRQMISFSAARPTVTLDRNKIENADTNANSHNPPHLP